MSMDAGQNITFIESEMRDNDLTRGYENDINPDNTMDNHNTAYPL